MNRNRLLVTGAAVAAVLLAACSGGVSSDSASTAAAAPPVAASQTTPATMTLTGSVLLKGNDKMVPAGIQANGMFTCGGRNGYDDIVGGAPVIVSDQSGTILAKTELQAATDTGSYPMKQCDLPFSVEVPAGLPFYQVSIGNRDPYVASAAEAEAGLQLSIG